MTHYLIIANGNFLVKEIIEEAAQNKTIVALDGAASKIKRLGIMPEVIAGDFDSLSLSEKEALGIHPTIAIDDQPYQGLHQILIVPTYDQNATDLVKAIRYCDQQQPTSITLICASGGQLDHQEGAIGALRTEYKKNRPLLLYTEQQTVCYAKDEQVIIKGNIGDRFGIIAFPRGSFSSHGLRFDANNMALEFGFSDSTCNTLAQAEAVITVSGEALLIMPPELQSQRDFISKSEVARLEMLLRDARIMAD